MKRIRTFGTVLLCAMICVVCVGCVSGSDSDKDITVICTCVEHSSGSGTDMTAAIKSNYCNTVSITARFSDGSGACGSGVLVYKDGYIATNAHVITRSVEAFGTYTHEIANEITIDFWTNDDYNGMWVYEDEDETYTRTLTDISYNQGNPNDSTNKGVLYWDIEEDLAILRCLNVPSEYKNRAAVLRNTTSEPIKIGEPIATLGWSLGYFYRSSVGTVSSYMDRFIAEDGDNGVTKDFDYAILHDAVTIHGNSGGPLLDSKGRLLGLNTLILYLDGIAVEPNSGRVSTLVDVLAPGLGFSVAMSSMTIRAKLKDLNII